MREELRGERVEEKVVGTRKDGGGEGGGYEWVGTRREGTGRESGPPKSFKKTMSKKWVYICLYTFIYIQIPSYTSKWFYIPSYTPTYIKILNIGKTGPSQTLLRPTAVCYVENYC